MRMHITCSVVFFFTTWHCQLLPGMHYSVFKVPMISKIGF